MLALNLRGWGTACIRKMEGCFLSSLWGSALLVPMPVSFPQSFLVGVVVPDPEVLPSFAAKLGVKGSFEDLCQNQVSFT